MTVFLIILGALVVTGTVLYLLHRMGDDGDNAQQRVPITDSDNNAQQRGADAEPEVCCGAHAICEKGLPPAVPVYFDDEELDRFAGREPDSYTADEADEFRDVMLTLLPPDVIPWTQSIEQRGIAMPSQLRDELMMLISDTATA